MRLASYNVENLFDRAKVMLQDDWDAGRQTLGDFAAANKILGQQVYGAADKTELARLLIALGLENSDESALVRLRRNRGELLKRPKTGGIEILADGRADWVGVSGWVGLASGSDIGHRTLFRHLLCMETSQYIS